MREVVTKLSNRVHIKLSRALNFSSYKMSELALDIFYIFLSEIKYEDNELKDFKISIVELEAKIGRKIDRSYFESIENELANTIIQIDKSYEKLTICRKCEFNSKDGWIKFEFNEKIKVHIFNIEKNYVSSDIRNLFMIKGAYSKRLYLLLKQNKDMSHKLNISLSELRCLLGIGPGKYKLYSDFKRRVITHSESQFKNTDLNFSLEEIKTRRKVTDFVFRIKSLKNKLESNSKKLMSSIDVLNQWAENSIANNSEYFDVDVDVTNY